MEDDMAIDEMYTTQQAALYLKVDEAQIRLAIRHGELRAWSLPLQRGLLVRKSDLKKMEAEKEAHNDTGR